MPTATISRSYTSAEVCDIVGISYRQMDWWIRTGRIDIDGDASGSGSRRRWTQREVDALILCVGQTRHAQGVLDEFSSGAMWRLAMRGRH